MSCYCFIRLTVQLAPGPPKTKLNLPLTHPLSLRNLPLKLNFSIPGRGKGLCAHLWESEQHAEDTHEEGDWDPVPDHLANFGLRKGAEVKLHHALKPEQF